MSANGMVRPCSRPASDWAGRDAKDKEHAMAKTFETTVAVIGIDIGKNSFHIVGLDRRGAIVRSWKGLLRSDNRFLQTDWPKCRHRPALVTPHQAGVADNVCSNDCRQFPLLTGHGSCPILYSRSQRRWNCWEIEWQARWPCGVSAQS